jgi:photoactive yellow protein
VGCFLSFAVYDYGMAEIERILNLSEAELDALPLGIIRLDQSGKILYYNASQAELGHLTSKGSIGRNFFTEVAPCTAVMAGAL